MPEPWSRLQKTLYYTSCVTLGKLLNLSESQFLYMVSEGNNSTNHVELF